MIRRIVSFLLAAALCVVVFAACGPKKVVVRPRSLDPEAMAEPPILPMAGEEAYASGSGTTEDPYVIETRGQLIYLSNQVNDGRNLTDNFVLGADIDLEAMEWTPIGVCDPTFGRAVFSGIFDGRGHEIRNLTITERKENSAASCMGVFGYNAGTIENLGVVGVDIRVDWRYRFGLDGSVNAGGVAGVNAGNLLNCYAHGEIRLDYGGGAPTVESSDVYAGGLTGQSAGVIANSCSTVSVDVNYGDESGKVCAAGITVGGDVENCFAVGDVNASRIFKPYREIGLFSVGGHVENGYAYEGQTIYTQKGAVCTEADLNSPDFYTSTLGWDADRWDFSDISVAEGKYPKLKSVSQTE